MLQLCLCIDQFLPVDLIIAHDQQDAVAVFGDLGRINDHSHRGRVHDHIVVCLGQTIQQCLEPIRHQQREGVEQLAAHGHKIHTGDICLVQHFVLLGDARKIVRQAVLLRVLRELDAIGADDHAPPQVGVHQNDPLAALRQLPGQTQARKALALRSVGTGQHQLFGIPAQKRDVGREGVEGLVHRVTRLRKFSKFKRIHSVFPPGSFRPPSFWCLGSSPFSSGMTASVTRPVYFLMSSVVL